MVEGEGADRNSGSRRPHARKSKPPGPVDAAGDQGDQSHSTKASGEQRRRRRAPKFDGGLTDSSKQAAPEVKENDVPASLRYRNLPKEDTLTARLIRELSIAPYPDCIICFNAIHPAQPTWSCSPLTPISATTDDESGKETTSRAAETAQCCWATFHLKCIRSWAAKSVKDIEDAWRARGEERKGEWRCPGCQSKRMNVPTSYW